MVKLPKRAYVLLIVSISTVLVLYIYIKLFFSVPDSSLLTTPPSEEAGWHGIVPGKTSAETALQFLKGSRYARRASIFYRKTKNPDGTAFESIHWDNRTLNIIPLGFKKYNEVVAIDGTVERITIRLDHPIYVRDLLSYWGEPEAIARQAETTLQGGYQTSIYLLYTGYGMACRCVGLYSVMEGLLVSDSPVTHVYYFATPPSEDPVGGFPPLFYVNHPEETEGWSGYDPVP